MGLFGWKAPFPCRLGGNAHVNVDASYEAIRANLGDAFAEDENTAEDADTKAGARALGGAAAALEAFVAQVDPRALSTMLPRWEAILGLRASINDTDTERRNRVSARLLANFSGDVDGISRIAAESFYPWTTNLRFNTLSGAVMYWPGGNTLAGYPWYSTVCMIVVEYVRPAFANDDAVAMRRTACLSALDEYAPAWATFTVSESQSVGPNALKQGFFLNQPNIGVSSF